MDKKKFPKLIYVHSDENGNLLAYDREGDAIEDDGPTLVGQYQLVSIRKLAKEVVNSYAK
jgi:hypothetical protein